MKRRNFIRLTGMTTLGFIAGGNIFASTFKIEKQAFIEIGFPKIHVRHGIFNIQEKKQNGIHIQRDVFNKNGLELISEDRIVAIKVSDKHSDTYGIIDQSGFNSHSKKIKAIKLKANNTGNIETNSPSLIFSEIYKLNINGTVVKPNQAIIQNSSRKIEILSESDQFVFIYDLAMM